MAVDRKAAPIHNGLGPVIVHRLLTEALDQTPRREELLENAFAELHDDLSGDYRNVFQRKGRQWVQERGAELAQHHLNHVTAIEAFGDTFEYSRELKRRIDARTIEIEAASKVLGARIFDDIARQFMLFHAEGNLVDEEQSARVWQAAFFSPTQDIGRHMIEARYKEIVDEFGETKSRPVINRIWVIIPEKRTEKVEDYQYMMAKAFDMDIGDLAEDVKMTLIVPADSNIARIPAEQLADERIEIVELPLAISQFDAIGYTMLTDKAPTADAATKRDMQKHTRTLNQLPGNVSAAIRRYRADAFGGQRILPHPSFSGGSISFQDRLAAAYPQDDVLSLDEE